MLKDLEITVAEVARRLGCRPFHPLPPFAQGPHGGPGGLASSVAMPIRPELKYLYPIDWPQISHWVRFVRAKGRCQVCGRPHGERVRHLGDGRWWDEVQQAWRDGRGRKVPSPALAEDTQIRTTKVVLAAAHLDHDPAHCGRKHRNVRACASGAICSTTGPSTGGGSG